MVTNEDKQEQGGGSKRTRKQRVAKGREDCDKLAIHSVLFQASNAPNNPPITNTLTQEIKRMKSHTEMFVITQKF